MKLAIIVGATRQNRQSIKQAKWAFKTAKQTEGIEPQIIDLKDYPMPFFDEPMSPRYNPERKIDAAVRPWLDKISQFDAYIFVTPEYNHSIPAVLKNAIDYITFEMNRKPVAVVAHGTVGGARAVTDLKEILSESKAVPIPNAVTLAGMSNIIDDNGNLDEVVKKNPYGPQAALDGLLAELKWYSDALGIARTQRELITA